MAIDGLREDIWAAVPEGEPVVMVNLMQFKARADDGRGSGWDAYVRYSKAANALIKANGGRIIWTGKPHGLLFGPADPGAGLEDWDFMALVHYPDKAAFMAMIASDAYHAANEDRLNGLERHVLIATRPAYSRMGTD